MIIICITYLVTILKGFDFPVYVPNTFFSEIFCPILIKTIQNLFIPSKRLVILYAHHIYTLLCIAIQPPGGYWLYIVNCYSIHMMILPVYAYRASFRSIYPLPALIPSMLALHPLPI